MPICGETFVPLMGMKNGAKLRDLAATQMTPSQLEKAQDLARECARKNYKGC